jgi:hypothetical protein
LALKTGRESRDANRLGKSLEAFKPWSLKALEPGGLGARRPWSLEAFMPWSFVRLSGKLVVTCSSADHV